MIGTHVLEVTKRHLFLQYRLLRDEGKNIFENDNSLMGLICISPKVGWFSHPSMRIVEYSKRAKIFNGHNIEFVSYT